MTTRTRTHSALKWLANERAALAGELQRLDTRLAQLRALRDSARQDLDAVELRLRTVESRRESRQASVAALDASMKRLDPTLKPESIRAVNAQGRYGKRGTLKGAVLELLANGGKAGIRAVVLQGMLHERFGLSFDSKEEAYRWWHDGPGSTLRRLRRNGVVTSSGGVPNMTWYLTSALEQ